MVNDVIITRSVLLNATPERVWEALTHPGMTRQYLYNCEVSCDWDTGSTMRWRGIYQGRQIDAEGKVLDIVPGRMVRYSGFDRLTEGDNSRQGNIQVTHEIIPHGLKTKLLTTIEHFEGDETRAEYAAQQWDFEIMPRLQTLVETTL